MNDDAQRTLEQKALTNVRGLVDKMEAKDQAERKLQKTILVIFLVVLGVIAAAWVGGVFKPGGKKVEVIVQPAPTPTQK